MKNRFSITGFIFIILSGWLTSEVTAQQGTATSNSSAKEGSDKVLTQQEQILGIDVSHFQGKVNWQKVRDADILFVYDKASQGDHFVDPDYAENKTGAHSVGLLHGSYHFYTSDKGGKDQADLFIKIIDYGPGDMPPMLDLEQAGIKGDVDITSLQQEILIWLREVESRLKVKPIIYTNPTFGNRYLNHPDFGDYGLWIAEYGVKDPRIPTVWEDKGWLIWQRSDRGKVEGVVGEVDHDLFNPDKSFNTVLKN